MLSLHQLQLSVTITCIWEACWAARFFPCPLAAHICIRSEQLSARHPEQSLLQDMQIPRSWCGEDIMYDTHCMQCYFVPTSLQQGAFSVSQSSLPAGTPEIWVRMGKYWL